ncbi:MAG: hypothetical protein DMD35_18380 [Gemmatimonadetes bacterium]|nr:MAG: hypothetical protein DMD35_18380 [Gemmatimonadota bacterium]
MTAAWRAARRIVEVWTRAPVQSGFPSENPFMRAAVRLALTLASVSCALAAAPAHAQTAAAPDSAKLRLVRQLIASAHLTEQAIQVIEQALPAQRAANPRVPAAFWDRFLEQARARRGELEDGYVALYDRNFTAAELRAMIAFYESPIGKRFVEVQPVLLREGMAMGQEWGTRIGSDVGRTLAAEGAQPGP